MKLRKLAVATAFLTGLGFAGAAAVFMTHSDAPHQHGSDGQIETLHGGGLDACGGHWNRKLGTYHYHRNKC